MCFRHPLADVVGQDGAGCQAIDAHAERSELVARWRASMITPAFAAAYATGAPTGRRAALEAIVITEPRPRSIMPTERF
jgi:hypothetical protein